MRKRMAAFALASVMALSLFGCGAKSNSASSAAGVSGDFTGTAKGTGLEAVVDFGSGASETLSLDEDHDYLYDVGDYVVHLQVKDGAIAFLDSQCPDHICEQFGWLDKDGAWAACVPAGVYVVVQEAAS